MAKVIVMLGGKEIGTYPMKTYPFTVGREASCNVHIDNVGVSRRHCQFTLQNGRYFVEDLGSSNGTYFKSQRVQKQQVEDGSQIGVGKYVLVFEDQGLEFLPTAGGGAGKKASAPGLGGLEAMKTFQLAPGALREQIAKADATAAAGSEARRAKDMARAYDPDAAVEVKRARDTGRYVAAAIKVLGLAVVGAGILIAFLFVFNIL